jgi:hypothetical protein
MLNLVPIRGFVIKWHQSADHPALPLQLASRHGELPRRLQLAHFSSPHGKSAVATCQEVGGGRYEWRLGLAHFHNEYSFMMISQKLYDFSLFILLIPSPF